MVDYIIELIKEQVCWAVREIYERKLVNIGEGNISARINEDSMIITPSGVNYRDPGMEDMVHIDFKGEIYSQAKKPSSEYLLHKQIYLARPKVQAIIHTHSTYASALSVSRLSLPTIFEEMVIFLGGEVPCTKFASSGTEDLGKNVLIALKKQNAVLLANHGQLVVGKTLEYCVNSAQLVEKMAKIYLHAPSPSFNIISDVTDKNQKFTNRFIEEFSTY
ncbi:MAG: class II aldolase/adducin family protein [Candidatus Heimdallarchaeota archaeon]|nr:class II aldolase/adducin family protein [Candidatus Heimdallarchaeota archaeon]